MASYEIIFALAGSESCNGEMKPPPQPPAGLGNGDVDMKPVVNDDAEMKVDAPETVDDVKPEIKSEKTDEARPKSPSAEMKTGECCHSLLIVESFEFLKRNILSWINVDKF